PIGVVISGLLLIVAFSYRQTIHAYPSGGGAYIVAKENIGPTAGLIAAAALLIDYVMTVAVSIAAGVAAVVSAFPQWHVNRTEMGLACIVLIAIGNLRGIREPAARYRVGPPVGSDPGDVTVVSQLARGVFGGRGALSYAVQAATTLILILAANTAFADFPRLSSIIGRDRYLPRQFMNQGDR